MIDDYAEYHDVTHPEDTYMAEKNGTTPVHLKTAHDHSLVVQALEMRAEGLDKLGKKTEEEGYGREARTIKSDAATIRQTILPEFAGQQELALVDTERLHAAIANTFGDLARAAVRHGGVEANDPSKQEEAFEQREERLAGRLATRVLAFARDLAEQAYRAGYAARESEPDTLVLKSVDALRARE